jgi:hypothetical protein
MQDRRVEMRSKSETQYTRPGFQGPTYIHPHLVTARLHGCEAHQRAHKRAIPLRAATWAGRGVEVERVVVYA